MGKRSKLTPGSGHLPLSFAKERGPGGEFRFLLLSFMVFLLLLNTGCIGPNQARMREGNRRYRAGDFARAKESYGSLAVDLPRSPQVQGNLALAHYRLGEWAEALAANDRALARTGARDGRLQGRWHYNQGVSYFQQAVKVRETGEQMTLLQKSLDSFKQAILANSRDLDAKYNYEFVKRFLEQKRQEERDKEPGRESGDGRDEERKNPGGQDGKEDSRDGKENQGDKDQPQPEKDTGQEQSGAALTPEQAAEILKQAESLERFAVAPQAEEQPVEKDW